jgi:hypothetical protein
MHQAPATVDDPGPAREQSSSRRFRALFAERGFAFLDDGDGRDVFRLRGATGRAGKGIADGSPDEAPREKAQPSAAAGKLGFVLEGPAARGLTLRAEGIALLVFKQFAADDVAGAIVEGEKLKPLLAGEQTLAISVTPEDGLAIDGPHAGQAQFKDGQLRQAQPFRPAGAGRSRSANTACMSSSTTPARGSTNSACRSSCCRPARPCRRSFRRRSSTSTDCGRCRPPPRSGNPSRALAAESLLRKQSPVSQPRRLRRRRNQLFDRRFRVDRSTAPGFDALRGQLATTLDANLYESSSVWDAFDGSDTTAPAPARS